MNALVRCRWTWSTLRLLEVRAQLGRSHPVTLRLARAVRTRDFREAVYAVAEANALARLRLLEELEAIN